MTSEAVFFKGYFVKFLGLFLQDSGGFSERIKWNQLRKKRLKTLDPQGDYA